MRVVNCAVPEYPQSQVATLQAEAARLLETRALEAQPEQLARELLLGFVEVCLRTGHDGVLAALGWQNEAAVDEHPEVKTALAAKLGDKASFDPRGPRNVKPKQLVDSMFAVLGMAVIEEPEKTVTLDDDLRRAVAGAISGVIEPAFAVPKIRDEIVSRARAACEERHLPAFEKIAAQLDERGMRVMKQPKVPLDAVQAVQHALFEARAAVLGAACSEAIDRAKAVLAGGGADAALAADRIDQPVTLALTPRQLVIRRVVDARTSKLPQAVVQVTVDALAELTRIAWRAQEQQAIAYSASRTFAVGEHIEHPKFGRGKVVSVANQRIEVDFGDKNKVTLVHARS